MKLYEYIFYPDYKSNGEWTVEGMDLERECVERTQGPLICMTIEELKEVFGAGMDYGRNIRNMTLKELLDSKGIDITENGK